MLKKFFILFFLTIFLFGGFLSANAQEQEPLNIYFFWGEGCPHCESEKPFLAKMEQKYPQIKVQQFEVWNNAENRKLLIEFGKKLNADVSGVPFTVIGEHYVVGWLNESYTGTQIEDAINCYIKENCQDIGKEIIKPVVKESVVILPVVQVKEEQDNLQEEIVITSEETPFATDFSVEERSPIPEKINFPLIGEIKTKNLSLPVFTIVLGALDGFNPCAMWTLLFLISLLLGMENKKRMWILGSAFIIVSAAVYFIFMAAWLNLLLFLGFVFWIRILIGLVALGGGSYNLKEYFKNPEATCKVTGTEKRQKIFAKLKEITHQKSFYLALGGIILLAFAVNLVELICSAGLPAIYTQVLAMSDLAKWQYYAYIGLYILIFMLDDLIIFFIAMTTLHMTGVTTKYARFSHLIGGVLMLLIGLLLIFRPEWLMFG